MTPAERMAAELKHQVDDIARTYLPAALERGAALQLVLYIDHRGRVGTPKTSITERGEMR